MRNDYFGKTLTVYLSRLEGRGIEWNMKYDRYIFSEVKTMYGFIRVVIDIHSQEIGACMKDFSGETTFRGNAQPENLSLALKILTSKRWIF